MPPSLQLSSLHLRVPDLARSVDFYARQLGFVVTRQAAGRADLATSAAAPPILTLTEDRTAPAAPRDAAGLFHAALLFPNRAALGGWLRFATGQGVEFDGFSDHGVSEAIYFTDPDGNGLEFYADRPREQWPYANGELAMTTQHLDVESLLAAAKAGLPSEALATAGLPATGSATAGAHWGHLHLRVTDLERSDAFYRATLELQLTQGTYPGARFLAADGYHHHLGLNTWGHPRQPQPAGALGLAAATFARAAEKAPRTLRDPDGIALHLTPL